ncbi:hypothetical protein [Luteitalea sp.]|uniref:hypothetical protein n=1 Tax=Luteitalea sp. TaxID=2004800 RepID=UPI0025BAD253|nr:hypothetical protein [Luteitalea sp.]
MAVDSIPGKLDALAVRVGDLEHSFASLEARVHEAAEALHENTEITRQIAQHTGTIVEMVRAYGDVKSTAKVVKSSVNVTTWLVAKVAVLGGAIAAAWHWLAPKG